MENCKEVLKSLKVDWDTTLNPECNQLKLALKIISNPNTNKNFRETFHLLEEAIEKIISSNSTVFSEAFNQYSKLVAKNRAIISAYEQVEALVDQTIDLGTTSINCTTDNKDKDEIDAIYQICAKIVEGRNLYKEFNQVDSFHKKSDLIMRCLVIFEDKKLRQIKGVDEFCKIVLNSYDKFCDQVNHKILDFCIKNSIESLEYVTLVTKLKSIISLNRFLEERMYDDAIYFIRQRLFKLSYEHTPDTIVLVSKTLVQSLEQILSNMEYLIGRLSRTIDQEEQTDFFGKVNTKRGFVFDIEKTYSLLKDLCSFFIDLYSYEHQSTFDFTQLNVIDINSHNSPSFFIGDRNRTVSSLLEHVENKQLLGILLSCKKETVEEDDISAVEDFIGEIKVDLASKNEYSDSLHSKILQVISLPLKSDQKENMSYFLTVNITKLLCRVFNITFTSPFVKKSNFSELTSNIDHIIDKRKAIAKSNYRKEDEKMFKAELYITDKEEFIHKSTREIISKNHLFLSESKYEEVLNLIKKLKEIEEDLKGPEIDFLIQLFIKAALRQAELDLFYYFDLFYRQGNCSHYIRFIIKIYKSTTKIISQLDEDIGVFTRELKSILISYTKMNVSAIYAKNKRDLEDMRNHIQILYENMGEVFDLIEILDFFEDCLKGIAKDKYSKILIKKIGL